MSHDVEWLTLVEAAERMHVSYSTAKRWVQKGLLRTTKVGGLRMTRTDWLDDLLLDERSELERARRAVETLFGRTNPPVWLRGMRLVAVAAIAIAVGGEVEDAWRCEWHPFGLDLDSLAGIVVAVVLVLLLERLLLHRLARKVDAWSFARIRRRIRAQEI